jgi:multidrug efflux pump subunit AcrA (membrane-fusion protein)
MSGCRLNIDVSQQDLTFPEKADKKRKRLPSLLRTGAYIAMVAVVYQARSAQLENLPPAAPAMPEMTVSVVHPEKPGLAALEMPGQLSAYTEAPIYAQTSGYLRSWYFDIGAKVKANDILGEIDTPEVDRELAQAKAQILVDQSVKIVRAPFDGVVIARNTDIGAYVPAGSGTQLFRMAATSRLRVYVTVPQVFSSLIQVGEHADLTIDQFPGRKFTAQVIGTAGAISSDAKRLLTELQVPNPAGELLPGSHVQITLDTPIDDRGVIIPPQTLLFASGQPAVAVVSADSKVAIQAVTVIHDLGSRLQVSGGISEADQLIKNPSPALVTGTVVSLVKPTEGQMTDYK